MAQGTWQRTSTNPPAAVGEPLLLTDGTVICHSPSSRNWYKLTPTNTGSYQNGTWSTIASMQSGYAPLYFASAVLKDGRVVVTGGEYNSGSAVWTNKGAWYDPQTNVWTSLTGPGWAEIGDAQCVVMPDGKFVLAHILDTKMASLNPATMTWTNLTGSGKVDRFDEEGWTLLPEGNVLTVCAINAPVCQKYRPSTDSWISAGSTPATLCDAGSQEIGPAVLLPNGKVYATGATINNAVYTPGATGNDPGSWVAAPAFGGGNDIADGPACLLPNGNVLVYVSPGVFNTPAKFMEYNPTTNTNIAVPNVPNSPGNPSYVGNMLMLPNGQLLFTDFSNDVEIYTPSGTYNNAWRPTITSAPTSAAPGSTFVLSGTQLNGLSQCSSYGDDSTNATNYPIVRITNNATGHVKYCRTHDHSTMAVATGAAVVSTQVTVPAGIELGASTMVVVANGIPSTPVNITVGTTEFLSPLNVTIGLGQLISGNVGSLKGDDQNALKICKAFVPNQTSPIIRFDSDYVTSLLSATSIKVDLKARMTTGGLFAVRTFLADVSGSGTFVFGGANQVIPDSVINLTFANYTSGAIAPGNHIDTDADATPNGTIRSRVEIQQTGFSAVAVPCSEFEQLSVTVTG